MSRKQRILKKRYAIFCEGDTEYNYTEKMRKNQGVELVLKPINMHGGGYSNFLRQIKKEAQTNYHAFKNDKDVYEFLNTGKRSFEKMLNAIRVQEKLVRNKYEIKKKTFEISIKSTEFNEDMLGRKVSNIDEFFDVIDW